MSTAKLCMLLCWAIIIHSPYVLAGESDEYTLKAAFLYNFAAYTTWPDSHIDTFNLCIYGSDPFGSDLDFLLKKKKINERTITIRRTSNIDHLDQCQLVFISNSATNHLTKIIGALEDKPVLTVADSPGANQLGVALNMAIREDKVTFIANLNRARKAGLSLSAQLLRFATEVHQ